MAVGMLAGLQEKENTEHIHIDLMRSLMIYQAAQMLACNMCAHKKVRC